MDLARGCRDKVAKGYTTGHRTITGALPAVPPKSCPQFPPLALPTASTNPPEPPVFEFTLPSRYIETLPAYCNVTTRMCVTVGPLKNDVQ